MTQPQTFAQAFQGYARLRAWCRDRGRWGQGNMVGAYAEHLVANALHLTVFPPTHPGCDAIEQGSGLRYEIKGLFRAPGMWSSWMAENRAELFDRLAVVIFTDEGAIERAHLVPVEVVREHWQFGAQQKWWLTYRPALWTADGVIDITTAVRAIADAPAPTLGHREEGQQTKL